MPALATLTNNLSQNLPHEVLSINLPWHDEDQKFWWFAAAPILGQVMSKAGHSIALQYHYLLWMYRCILPVLDARPGANGNPHFDTFCTDDFSPLEISWNHQDSSSIVRIGMEPIGASAGTRRDPFNDLMGPYLMEQLADEMSGLDMRLFHHFQKEFFVRSEDADAVRAKMAPNEHGSVFFVAFDLRNGHVLPKAYFYPIIKALQTGIDGERLISDAISKLDAESTLAFATPLAVLQDFVVESKTDPAWAFRYECVAVDCVEPSQSRIKIYVRTPLTSLNRVCEAYTLGGRLQDPATLAGVQALRTLWPMIYGSINGDEELPVNRHRTTGTIFNYKLRSGDATPYSKIYIPVRHYAKNDQAIAEGLAAFFISQGWKSKAASYASDLQSIFLKQNFFKTIRR